MKYIMSKVFLGMSERNTAYSQNAARATEKEEQGGITQCIGHAVFTEELQRVVNFLR